VLVQKNGNKNFRTGTKIRVGMVTRKTQLLTCRLFFGLNKSCHKASI